MSAIATTISALPDKSGATSTAAKKLTDNFDSFLTLLTTQLKNQDPLSPMDTETFTQQLVQFTSVEQSIKTNDSLEKLIGLVQGTRRSAALDYLGKTVDATSDKVSLGAQGTATIAYELPADAAGVAVKILDESGRQVAETRGSGSKGAHQMVWDGIRSDGVRAQPGTYRIAVAATTADGQPIQVKQVVSGVVDAVAPSDEETTLSVNGVDVALSSVLKIDQPT